MALVGVAILLVAIPVARSAEMNEHGSSRERAEELTLVHRLELDRHLRCENRPAAIMQPARSLGHSQRPILDPLSGHRLPNGLLAPITC